MRGYWRTFFPFRDTHAKAPKCKKHCSVGLLVCIFIALLALSNKGVRAHFFPYGSIRNVFTILKPQPLVPVMESSESGGTIHYKHYSKRLLEVGGGGELK